jgi:phosphate transport system permease protein
MSPATDSITAADRRRPATTLRVFSRRFARRKFRDIAGRWAVTLGGALIIATILAILVVIVGEVYPLVRPATAIELDALDPGLGDRVLAIEMDEYRALAAVVTAEGLQFVSLTPHGVAADAALPTLGAAHVTAVSANEGRSLALGLSDGRVIPIEISFHTSGSGEMRRVEGIARSLESIQIDPSGRPIRVLASSAGEDGLVAAAVVDRKQILVARITEESSLIGEKTRQESRVAIDLDRAGDVSALAIDARGDNLFAGTTQGEVVTIELHGSKPRQGSPKQASSRPGAQITLLGFLLGDRTLVIGDEAGGVATWQLLRAAETEPVLTRIHEFPSYATAVTAFSASRRNKGFWTGDRSGALRFDYGTTGQTLLELAAGRDGVRAVSFAPKSNGLMVVDRAGHLLRWDIDCPHPEVSLRALFGKLWYEGYDRPSYVWQSTGGSDDFEPKFSLIPLLVGTLKGTLYAMLVAVPIALLGALYASQFMHARLKAMVKPTVELMAALPSVVLGFMAGLWLAPNLERVVPGLVLSPLITSALVLAVLTGWRMLPGGWRTRLRSGTEVFLLIPVVLVGLWLSFGCGRWIEATFLGGDYRSWLLAALGVTYDQRNSIVVGIAMGFAVIPVIFTIAEDSLANVPPHLAAGSLALGATPWQTAVRVVLPTASPGIFSAVMIGFGRAVGETMIVLMATGNTPILSWSPFNGFRALSANIAVELPEAPDGGTLFRVLFVAALLLFVMTFLVNTLAELVRLRLRQKYRTL